MFRKLGLEKINPNTGENGTFYIYIEKYVFKARFFLTATELEKFHFSISNKCFQRYSPQLNKDLNVRASSGHSRL